MCALGVFSNSSERLYRSMACLLSPCASLSSAMARSRDRDQAAVRVGDLDDVASLLGGANGVHASGQVVHGRGRQARSWAREELGPNAHSGTQAINPSSSVMNCGELVPAKTELECGKWPERYQCTLTRMELFKLNGGEDAVKRAPVRRPPRVAVRRQQQPAIL